MKLKKHPILIVLLSFGFHCVFAQSDKLHFKSIISNNGLSSNNVTSIIEDQTGFMWFGTASGLNRFDGYDFKIFQHDFNDSTSLSDDEISAIIEEKSTGNLWVGTIKGGLNYFDRSTGSFRRLFHGEKNRLNQRRIQTLFYDSQNVLWVGGSKGLYRANEDGSFSEFMIFPANPSNPMNNIYSIEEDENGNLWIGNREGVFHFNTKTYKVKLLTTAVGEVNELLYNKESKKLWIGTKANGLFMLKNEGDLTSLVSYTKENGFLPGNKVADIIKDSLGNFYLAITNGGFVYFDLQHKKTFNYVPDIYDPNSINSIGVLTVYKSSTDIIWIGTFDSGVNYIDLNRKPFEHYQFNNKSDGIMNNNIRALFEDREGQIWIGTKEGGGLSLFNKEKGTFINYQSNINDPKQLHGDYVLTINDIDAGHLLIGTYRNGLNELDKRTGLFTHHKTDPKNPNAPSSDRVYAITKDHNGTIRTSKDVFDPTQQSFKAIEEKERLRDFYFAVPENDFSTWFGGIYGGRKERRGVLALYNSKTGTVKEYHHDPKDSTGLGPGSITGLKKDSENNLWIGKDGGGIILLNQKREHFKSFTVADGLPTNRILSLLIDDEDHIWVSTTRGISRFNPRTEEVRNYDIYDGLQGNEFSRLVALKTKSGELLFGGKNGFNIFNPKDIKDNLHAPPVVISSFKLFNKEVVIGEEDSPLSKHILYTNEICLTAEQSSFSFGFQALNYSSPEKNQYAYRMEGIEEEWNYVGTAREARYSSLPAGEYVFHVKASNNDGVWNEEGTSVSIVILPFWWQTSWFKVSIFVLLSLISLVFYKWRIYSYQREEHRLQIMISKATVELEQRASELVIKNQKIEQQTEELNTYNDALEDLNEKLEEKVSNRTSELVMKNQKLEEYTFINSHELRKPVSNILGLIQLMESKADDIQDPDLMPLLKKVTENLDKKVKEIQRKLK